MTELSQPPIRDPQEIVRIFEGDTDRSAGAQERAQAKFDHFGSLAAAVVGIQHLAKTFE